MTLIRSDDFSSANDGWELNWITGWVKHATYNKSLYIYGAYSAATVVAYGSDQGFYYRSETPDSADQSVACDFIFGDYGVEAEKSGWICARVDTASATMYRGGHVEGEWRIEKVVSGTVTVLASVSDVRRNQTVNCRLEVIGSTLNLYGAGASTPTLTATDNSITAAGKVGIGVQGDVLLRIDNFYAETIEAGGNSAPTTISATIANISGSITSKSNPKTAISATLANITASVGSTVGTLTTTITATLGNIVGSITSTGNTTNGTFTSEVLKDYAGNVLSNTALNFVRFYNDTTGALVLSKTGVSTNGSGIVTFSDAALVAGTTYRVDWETSAGSRRMPRKAAA